MTCVSCACYSCDNPNDPNSVGVIFEQIPEEADTSEPCSPGKMAKMFKVVPSTTGATTGTASVLTTQFFAFDSNAKGPAAAEPFYNVNGSADVAEQNAKIAKDLADSGSTLQVGPAKYDKTLNNGLHLLQYQANAAGNSETMIIVLEVQEGIWSKWNAANAKEPEKQIKPWDRIVEVNGVSGDGALVLAELQKSTAYGLKVKRPVKTRIEFEAIDLSVSRSLGLELNALEGGMLCVSNIRENGLIHQWNEKKPESKVSVSDRLYGVNGYTNKEEMLTQLKHAPRLDLVFWRQE